MTRIQGSKRGFSFPWVHKGLLKKFFFAHIFFFVSFFRSLGLKKYGKEEEDAGKVIMCFCNLELQSPQCDYWLKKMGKKSSTAELVSKIL